MNKKTKITFFALSIVSVLLLVLVIISASPNSDMSGFYKVVGTPFTLIQKGFSKLGTDIREWFVYIGSYEKVSKEIEDLRSENDRIELLESENDRLTNENRELRDLMNLKDYTSDYTLAACSIIAEDVTDWFNTFTIDLGTADGVKNGDPVVTSAGLVGIVTEAGITSSKILTIVDEDNAFMCRVARTNELVRVRGVSGESLEYKLRIDRATSTSKIIVGDTVVTADSGGVYPAGLIVGTITEVSKNQDTGEITAVVKPSVDLTQLSKVYVMKNYEEKED